MKFEQILKIYWSKGFYYNSVLFNYDTTLDALIDNCSGVGKPLKKLLIDRFEWWEVKKNRKTSLIKYSSTTHYVINKMFSKINPFNHTIHELTRFHIIRLYLIRSTRGRAQSLGKPSRGQRTWSNAWTAHYNSQVIKSFLTLVKKLHAENKKPEKIDYRRLKKRVVKKKAVTAFKKQKPKLNAWF
jgi:ribosomal protein S13